MSNVLRKEKKQEVTALGRLGWTLRQIEEATGIRRETASRYLKAAGIAVRRPGWGQTVSPASVHTGSESKPAIQATTDSESKAAMGVTTDFVRLVSENSPILLPASKVSSSRCEPFRETIELELGRGRNAMGIWQDLVDKHGFSGDYESVKRFVRKLRGSPQYQASGIIITEPGAELQVDYGTGPMVRNPQTGKYRRTRLFVATRLQPQIDSSAHLHFQYTDLGRVA